MQKGDISKEHTVKEKNALMWPSTDVARFIFASFEGCMSHSLHLSA